MSKIIDITDKLNFRVKPQIKVRDVVITVNNEATSILKILPKISQDKMQPADILDIIGIILDEDEIKKLEGLHLDFKDFVTFIESAVTLITGDNEKGEALTPAMT